MQTIAEVKAEPSAATIFELFKDTHTQTRRDKTKTVRHATIVTNLQTTRIVEFVGSQRHPTLTSTVFAMSTLFTTVCAAVCTGHHGSCALLKAHPQQKRPDFLTDTEIVGFLYKPSQTVYKPLHKPL